MISIIKTNANNYRKLYATVSSTASFPTLVPTMTQPSGDGTVVISPYKGGQTDNSIRLAFFGVLADNSTYKSRVISWTKASDIWIPEIICNLDLITGTSTGDINSHYINNTYLFADTISFTVGTSNTTNMEIISPANNTVGCVTIDLAGAQIIQVVFDTSNTNCLYRLL